MPIELNPGNEGNSDFTKLRWESMPYLAHRISRGISVSVCLSIA